MREYHFTDFHELALWLITEIKEKGNMTITSVKFKAVHKGVVELSLLITEEEEE